MGKLKEIIQYLAYLSGKKPHRLNNTKLTKLLWLFESIMYARNGIRPLGLTFRRNKHGFISSEVFSMLAEFWRNDKKQTSKENQDKNPILIAINIPEMKHLSAEEVALLSWLYNMVFTKSKSPIDTAMANLPPINMKENLVGGVD